jgi:ABC-2 type transport system permease protein
VTRGREEAEVTAQDPDPAPDTGGHGTAPRARVLDVRYTAVAATRPSPERAVAVLARWSVLRVLGVRRSWTAKLWPFALVGAAFAPGLGVLAVRALFADGLGADAPVDLLPYREYLEVVHLVVLVFTATVVPALLCPDRRDRVLSLYRSTATTGLGYLAAKALAAAVLLLTITVLPVLLFFAGNLLFAADALDTFTDDADVLWRVPLAAVLVTLVHGALGLAVASLTGRRAVAVGAYLALVVATPVLGQVLATSQGAGTTSSWHLLDVAGLPFTLGQRVFGEAPGPPTWQLAAGCAVVVTACTALLVARYGGDET